MLSSQLAINRYNTSNTGTETLCLCASLPCSLSQTLYRPKDPLQMHPSQTSQTLQNDAVYIWVWYSYCATCHQKMLKWTWYDDVIWCWKRLIRSHGMSKQLKRHRKRNSHDGQLNLFETTKVQTQQWPHGARSQRKYVSKQTYPIDSNIKSKIILYMHMRIYHVSVQYLIFWIKWLKSLSCWCVLLAEH